jgi:4-amino-4-deoxy-L-arabinose transferase-like glycosyltransferase
MSDAATLPTSWSSPGRLGWCAAGWIVLFGLTMLAAGLDGRHRTLTAHEVIYAQPAREMIHTGQWLLPPLAGEPVVHKPPLTHWIIAGAMAVFGAADESVARLPSVLAAIAAALLLADLGSRLYSRRAGLLVGLAHLTAGYTLWKSRLAETDTLLTLWVVLAFYAAARALAVGPREQPPARRWALLLWAAAGLSNMTKYGVGVAMIVAGVAVYGLIARDRRTLRLLVSPAGWLLAGAITLPWPLAAAAWHEPFVAELRDNILGRASGEYKGSNRPWWTYLYAAPMLAAPWTIWIVGALVRARGRGLLRSRAWLLALCWSAAAVAGLSFAAFRKEHYIMPALPPLMLLAGWMLEQDTFVRRGWRPPWPALLGAIVAAWALGLYFMAARAPQLLPELGVVATLLAALLGAAVILDRRARPVGTLAALLAAMWILGFSWQVHGERHWDGYRPRAELARRVNVSAPFGEEIYISGLYRDQIAFYLRLPVRRIESPATFAEFAAGRPGQTLHVLADPSAVETFRKIGRVETLDASAAPPHDPDRRPVLYVTVTPHRRAPDSTP